MAIAAIWKLAHDLRPGEPLGEKWNTKPHIVAESDRDGVVFVLSASNCGDAPEGRTLLQQLGPVDHSVYLLMDRAYEGDETRALAVEPGSSTQKQSQKSLGL